MGENPDIVELYDETTISDNRESKEGRKNKVDALRLLTKADEFILFTFDSNDEGILVSNLHSLSLNAFTAHAALTALDKEMKYIAKTTLKQALEDL